jgi:GNAT superfamily N-acetyltransferase
MKENSRISIDRATVSDVPTILGFIRGLAKYEQLSHEVEATEELLNENLFGPRPAAEAILARFDNTAVGFALYFTTYSTFTGRPGIWLEDLFVLPDYRHRGVGRALLRAVVKIAVERKCGRLEWSVLDWNEPALRVYRKIGAVAMSEWTTQRMTGEALERLAGER